MKRLIALDRWWMKGVGTKAADNMGSTRGRPSIPSQLLEPSTSDPLYVPVPEPESSGTDDSVTWLEGGEEVATTTADDTACLQETDRAPPNRVKVNKMCKKFSRSMAMGSGATGAPLKRNPKCRKAGIKENYSWVHPCFIIKEDKVTCKTTGKQIVVAIWAICKLCKFKSPDCRAYGVKTKPGNCPSWTGCIKHVDNIHCLAGPKGCGGSSRRSKSSLGLFGGNQGEEARD